MIISQFEQYIKDNSTDSPLIKCFAQFLFNNNVIKINQSDIDLIISNKSDYKNVAAIGFLLNRNTELTDEFIKGLERQKGREIGETHPLIFDNAGLLGMILGINILSDKSSYKTWIQQLLEKKIQNKDQISYSIFLQALLNNNIIDRSEVNEFIIDTKECGLNIFLKIITAKIDFDLNIIAEYLIFFRKKQFPYFEGDIFLTFISVFNIDNLLRKYIIDQETIKEKINKEIEKVRYILDEKYYNSLSIIKNQIDKKAKRKAKWIFFLILMLLANCYFFIGKWIWIGDWNWFEPKTYVLFGTPILSYLTISIVYLITEKEFSINPKNIIEYIEEIERTILYKDLSFNIEYWKHLKREIHKNNEISLTKDKSSTINDTID